MTPRTPPGRSGPERGVFPLFNADLYLRRTNLRLALAAGTEGKDSRDRSAQFASAVDCADRHHQPAFADNASNGIEPPFSWSYLRKKRMPDGTTKEYAVEDHARRLFHHLRGETHKSEPLPHAFVTALEMSAKAHEAMVAAVAPYVDTAISKTVNVPADYPYADFQDLYLDARRSGLGLATYRPNAILGSVLSTHETPKAAPAALARAMASTSARR